MADKDVKAPTPEPARSLDASKVDGGSSSNGNAISLDELVLETSVQAAAHADFLKNESTGGAGLASSSSGSKNESVAGAPVPGDDSKSRAASAPAVADPNISLDRVDDVLNIEDPNFVNSLDEIKKIGSEVPKEAVGDLAPAFSRAC